MENERDRQRFGAAGRFRLRIPDAAQRARMVIDALFFECGKGTLAPDEEYFDPDRPPVIPAEYGEVFRWLADSEGLGLVLRGGGGTGKTMLARTVIPSLVREEYRRVMTFCPAREMNARQAEILDRRLLVIDDIGTEDAITADYGTRRMLFPQIVDNISQKGGLLVATTNLTREELQRKYGFRTLDRLSRMARFVTFPGESLRNCRRWGEMTREMIDFWDEEGRRYSEWKRGRAEASGGEAGRAAYSAGLRRWYEERAGECGMDTDDWLEWKAADLGYLHALWEKARATGEKTAFFEWWLRGKDLWREEFGEGNDIQNTAVKAIRTPQISTERAGAV